MLQVKSPQEIRRDALRQARVKLEAGCLGCTESYLITARAHGASDEEIVPILRDWLGQGAIPGQIGQTLLASALLQARS